MKKIGKILVALICILVIVTGCGNKETSKTKQISLGSWTENTYTNDFLGVTYNMPEGWTRYTDEEIKEVMELGSELTDASELSKKLSELTSVTYMMTSSVTGTNVILMSEKPVISVSERSYAESLKTQLEAQTAMKYNLSEIKTETIDGKEFVTIEADVETLKQKYYIYKVDKCIVCAIITATANDDVNTIVEQFEFK